MQMLLSHYGRASTQPSPVNRMMSAFAGTFRDGVDINLGVGYVNERTIPVAALEEALAAVAGDSVKFRQAFNYGGPEGSPNLIAALRNFVGQRAEGKRLVVGPCGATSVLDALTEVVQPGIVVTSDPLYYIYSDTLERKGFEILAVPEDADGIDLAALERKLAALGDRIDRLAFFYAVTVNNPSCTILSNARRRELLDVATRCSRQLNRPVPIFYDLAYDLLLHDPGHEPFVSVLPEDSLGIAYEVGSLSKVLAPALRIGYLLGPDGPFLDAMVQKTSDVGFSAPLFVQEMAAWLLERGIGKQLCTVNHAYRQKALAVGAGIREFLGPYVTECRGGSAGFYFYLTFELIETHSQSRFFRVLTEESPRPRVVYIPGEYCVHAAGELAQLGMRQLRLSYGFEETPRILEALSVMRNAADRM